MEVTASELKGYAREALKGRWLKAGGVAIIASFLGADVAGSGSFLNTASNSVNNRVQNGSANLGPVTGIPASVFAGILGFGLVVLLAAIAIFIISGATTLGYAKYNLNLIDDKDPQLSDLFSQFHRLGTGLLMVFLRSLYTALWTLLLVIPGIIAEYRYSMASYILYENPEMTANEAITESKMLMRGNKMRLFGLRLSFIGWFLLAACGVIPILMLLAPMVVWNPVGNAMMLILTFVLVFAYVIVVDLLLTPYLEAAYAAFYREIKDGKYSSSEITVETEAAEAVEAEVVDEPEF